MKYLHFKIDVYDWDVYYIEAERKKDYKAVAAKMRSLKVSKELIKETGDDVKIGAKNGGHHAYNVTSRMSVITLFESSNKRNRINIIFHEKRHVEDHICKHMGIDDLEAAAFLAGYIAEKLIPIL